MTSPALLTVDVHLTAADLDAALRADVRRGLTSPPRWLPPKWFYDERGSRLFADITELPEYYPTRCETQILAARAEEIAERVRGPVLVELGAGFSTKTRLLLGAGLRSGALTKFVPVDVDESTLREASSSIAHEYEGLAVHAIVGDFEHHLPHLPGGGRRLVAFLGGTIGNLDPAERTLFLAALAEVLEPGDALLLGTDLVKDTDRLVAAYDDSAGVTAAFNRNVLRVINRRLDAGFVPDRFEHVALWDAEQEWIEMRLRSTVRHTVDIEGLPLAIEFDKGDEIRTEISAKFRREGVEAELGAAGFTLDRWWTDSAGDFALSLSFL